MTEVKHFDVVFVFLDSVIHKNGAMLQLPDSGALSNHAAHAGKSAQQIDMVEESAAKLHRRLGIVLCNETDDFGEVA
ncbi:MAG TPA: hypothetical protein VNZ63_07555 [Verrucomicrobiae bacterium]|nr:hypothetical protein [Verrucomicrobiae bacterium]